MKEKNSFLVKFMVRAILGFAIIFFVNQFLVHRGIDLKVGFNVVSLVASGALGLPGVAMLYGIVAIPFL